LKKAFILLFILFALTGCGGPSKELINFAQQEKVWLEQSEDIIRKIDNDYALWINGKINRGELATKLYQYEPQAKKIMRDREKLISTLSEKDKKNDLYEDGLSCGRVMGLNVYYFILSSGYGYFSGNTNLKATPDLYLIKRYNASMIKDNANRRELLINSIGQLTK